MYALPVTDSIAASICFEKGISCRINMLSTYFNISSQALLLSAGVASIAVTNSPSLSVKSCGIARSTEYLSKVGFVMGIDTAEGKDRTIITDWIPCLKCGAWIIMDEDTPPKHRLCDDCLPFSLDKKEV